MSELIYRKNIFDDLKNQEPTLNALSYEELDSVIFKNHISYQLSFDGMRLLRKYYSCYEVSTRDIAINKRTLLKIIRNIKVPYYYGSVSLVLFSDEDAFLLQLNGNDVEAWISKYS